MFRVRPFAVLVASSLIFSLAGVVAQTGVANAVPPAPNWAVVDGAGTLVRGHNATSASSLGTGTYQVTFSSNVASCTYIATPGDPGAGAVSGPIEVTVATRAGNPNALFIQTFDQSTGALSSQPFHVVTYCGTKPLHGVIDSAGVLSRGANITSSSLLSTGSYEVIFKKSVKACAFNATLGTTSTGSIASPGVITVAGRSGNVKGVFVRIVDRTGASLDSSFHIDVQCGKKPVTAVIKGDGTKARGKNVVSSTKLSATVDAGVYEVIFNQVVSACAYTATVGTTTQGGSIGPPPVTITTATRSGNPSGVFIFIHNANGSTIDEPFHVIVQC